MRTAMIFNFLLEANLMASAAILLMAVFRKVLRKPLGNRLIYCLWLLIAIRLLCPLALANPLMNDFRPYYLDDQVIRPIAGQIKIRLTDAIKELQWQMHGDADTILYQGARSFVDGMYRGTTSKLLIQIYLFGAGMVLVFFGLSNIRFRRRLKANRIEEISGKLKEQYLAVCKERGVKPIPVWFADPLPSACLVGVIRPYIALPLTAAPQEAIHVLTHEICHYKGRDHWLGVLRLICCVVHWFNPLVWAAAYMSRTDGELACDSRVVKPLSPQKRNEYTNTLVLAASRRYAPGLGVLATGMTMTGKKLQNRILGILNIKNTVKWLMVTTAVLAVLALGATFFTAEGAIIAEPYLSNVRGFSSVSAGSDGTLSSLPGNHDIALEDAVEIALEAIEQQYNVDVEGRSRFSLFVDFKEYYWFLMIHDPDSGRTYEMHVDAFDGSVSNLNWGNG